MKTEAIIHRLGESLSHYTRRFRSGQRQPERWPKFLTEDDYQHQNHKYVSPEVETSVQMLGEEIKRSYIHLRNND